VQSTSGDALRRRGWGRRRLVVVAVVTAVAVGAVIVGFMTPLPYLIVGKTPGGDALSAGADGYELLEVEPGSNVHRSVIPENLSDDEVRITDISAVDPPAELTPIGASMYDADETKGFYMGWRDDDPGDDLSKELGNVEARPITGWTLEPAQTASDEGEYSLVGFHLSTAAGPGTYSISQFRIDYQVNGRSYQQVFDIPFAVTVS
jgi:hypothetical protein